MFTIKPLKKIWSKIKWPALMTLLLSPFLLAFLTIKNSRDCSQFVIDTYELYSGINIPEANSVNCYYDEEVKIRISVYDMNSEMSISGPNLVRYDGSEPLLEGDYLLAPDERPEENEVYYVASGRKFGRNWKYVFDNRSRRLWTELIYGTGSHCNLPLPGFYQLCSLKESCSFNPIINSNRLF